MRKPWAEQVANPSLISEYTQLLAREQTADNIVEVWNDSDVHYAVEKVLLAIGQI